MVLGDTTTALVNLASMFDVPAVRLAVPTTGARLSDDQSAILDRFVGPVVRSAELTDVIGRRARPPGGS